MINDLIFKQPEQEGVDSSDIIKFIDRLSERKINLHSFLIARNGNLITEKYYKPFNKDFKHRLYSSSKTIVSMAIGYLCDKHILSLSDKIMDLIPEYGNKEQSLFMKNCTVEDALKMSVPLAYDSYLSQDYKEWAWTFFNHPRNSKAVKPAGTIFNYNTSGTFILCVIIEKLTGKNFLKVLRPVFDKIGVSSDIWCIKSPDGYAWGGSGVMCTLRDFAKIAELLLNKGNYKGEQLISEKYITAATSKQISNHIDRNYTLLMSGGYGYQIWINKFGFAMIGMGSQLAFCFPDKNLLFVCQGDTMNGYDSENTYIFESFIHEILENIDKPQTNNHFTELQHKLNALALDADFGETSTTYTPIIDKKRYLLESNPMGWKWFEFDINNDYGTMYYENARGKKSVRFGMNKLIEGSFPETEYYDEQVFKPAGRELKTLTSASWTSENQLIVMVNFIDNNFGCCYMNFGFKEKDVGILLCPRTEYYMDGYAGYAIGRLSDK